MPRHRTTEPALAAVLAAVAVAGLIASPLSEPEVVTRPADAGGVALTLAMTLPIAFVRRHPRPAIAVAGLAALILSVSGYGFTLGALIAWGLVGFAALYSDRRTSVALGFASAASLAISVAVFSPESRNLPLLALAALVGALPAFVGDAQRRQRELTEQLRALQQAELERAVGAERLRSARDVHDTVGHHLSAISLQARAGELNRGGEALATIARLSDRALQDTRHTLGLLREASDEPTRPTPRVEALDELVDTAALAGVAVDVHLDGRLDDLPDLISTNVYRVVQEALTNTARHAAPARAEVRIHRGAGPLVP